MFVLLNKTKIVASHAHIYSTLFQGIDINQAWDFMCHYLLYEFRGAEEGLQEFIGSETRTTVLLSDIWLFYRSERLFLLKCINVLLTFHNDKGHPYKVGFFVLVLYSFITSVNSTKHLNNKIYKTIIL
jgi:hypothetical protein